MEKHRRLSYGDFSIRRFRLDSPRLHLASLVFRCSCGVNSSTHIVVRAGLKCIDVRLFSGLHYDLCVLSFSWHTLTAPMSSNEFKDPTDLLVVARCLLSTKHRSNFTSSLMQIHEHNVYSKLKWAQKEESGDELRFVLSFHTMCLDTMCQRALS